MLWDTNIESKYREKADHHKVLTIELSRLDYGRSKVTIIITPLIVGSNGCVKSNLNKALKDLSIEAEYRRYTLQKTAVLASTYILHFFFKSAKLRRLSVLRLDFLIQYSRHAHTL